MRAQDFLKDNVKYHNSLNMYVWDGEDMNKEVRYKLLLIAKEFIEYLDVPNFKLVDIVLRGSLTNYNYTQYSDFDLHLVTRYGDLQCDDIARAFYKAKKQIWNDEHDIIIHGHEVELYVEDVNEPNASQGAYSILRGEWIKQPTFDPPKLNDRAINAKVAVLVKEIESAISSGRVKELKSVKDKIVKMRKSGLADGGEYSTENLAFKILRNQGYITRLQKSIVDKQDAELGLAEDLLG